MSTVEPPERGDTWVDLTSSSLSVERAMAWAVQPHCGAVVTFSGTARDHSTGREGVTALEYEAYDDEALRRMHDVVEQARERWPDVARIVLWHRTGLVELGDAAVLVVASAPHRAEAFEAARFAIDALKATVPIWKREHWPGGSEWALDTQSPVAVEAVGVEA